MSLLALMGILAALAAMVVALSYKTVDFFAKSQVLDSDALFRMADSQLRQFIVANGRLPCPDTNGDGVADGEADGSCSGNQKGYLPYKTLGMTDRNYGYGEVPMLYGVFNNGNFSFASKVQIFVPTYADEGNAAQSVIASPSRNTFDFCASLATLKALPFDPAGLNVPKPTGSADNVVYALAQAGSANRDGLNAGWTNVLNINPQYDGLNASSAIQFESPQAQVTRTYDDRTYYRAASDLHDYFRCEAMNTSISLLADAVTVQKETEDAANQNTEDLSKAFYLNLGKSAMAIWSSIDAGASIPDAAEILAVASPKLAAATASCAILVGCAMVPVYTVAVVSAAIGEVLAVVATVAAITSLALQVTTTAMYGELITRTSKPITPRTPTMASIPQSKIDEVRTTYSDSKATAVTAYTKAVNALAALPPIVPPAVDGDPAAYKAISDSRSTTLASNISQVTDTTLKTFLGDALNGKTATCTPPANNNCAGYVAHQTPQTDANGKVILDANNQAVMNTTYTKDLVFGSFSPGVLPSLNGYYDAVAQAGVNQPLPVDNTVSTDPNVTNAQQTIANANAALAASPPVDPVVALTSSNTVTGNYGSLLGLIADFDQKNLAGDATARSAALQALQTAIGDPSWNYTGSTSLCGGGAVSGCGWMTNAAASPGNGTTPATTGSSTVNAYLSAYKDYQQALEYKRLEEASNQASKDAWGDRNSYKTLLCAVQTPSVQFFGLSSLSSVNPSDWDLTEALLSTPVTGLVCTGGGPPPDNSALSNSANASEAAKYCPGGSAPDARLCAIYGGAETTRTTIRGNEAVVNEVIRRGIVK